MLTKEHIGKIIRSYRVENGLTQVELFQDTGIPQSRITKIEHGKHDILAKDAFLIGHVLGIDWAFYFKKSEELQE